MATNPKIACPNCEATLTLKNTSLVGRKVPCPKCGERFVIALPSDSDETDSSDEVQVEAKRRPETSSRNRSAGKARKKAVSKRSGAPVKWIVIGGAAFVCVIIAGALFWSFGTRGTSTMTAGAGPQAAVIATQAQLTAPAGAENPAAGNTPAGEKIAAATPTEVASLEPVDTTPNRIDAKKESDEKPIANATADSAAAVTADAQSASNADSASLSSASNLNQGESVLGKTIPEFDAAAIDNTTFHSKDWNEKVVVVAFMGVECPLANLYYPNLVALAKQFAGKPVAFLAVNSNGQDTMASIRDQAKTHGVKFPVLKDAGSQVADLFGAERTPELFILDEDRVVRYHGIIDDQYGYQSRRQFPSAHYAADAVNNLLAGQDVALSETPLQGCRIGRKGQSVQKPETSFYRDVLPILQDHCQQCHRAGDIGPFALDDFDACSNWGETIKEAVTERRMPPWPAEIEHGKFVNDSHLPDKQLATLVKWVDEGCPEGNPADKPPEKEFVDGWNIGKPDREFAMDKPFEVPATGVVEYQHFAISPVFTQDVWVQAVECKYGDRSVVHHMLALLRFPKDDKRNQDGLRNGFFAAGAPGSNYLVFPPGHAKRIPKGAQLVLQMHYTPNGTRTKDQSRLGVIFAKEPIEYEVQTYAIGTTDILVKAGDANYTKTYAEPIDTDVVISALMPHLHMRGKSFEMAATTPDGKTQTLISLPKWDFNWQFQYQLAEPILLPKGSKISVKGVWDNSDKNPNNILPPVDARFGEQTFDEMFIGYVNFIVPKKGTPTIKSMGRRRG